MLVHHALGTIAGGITAYFINFWLVQNKLKHSCMTLPDQEPGPDMAREAMAHTQGMNMDMNMGQQGEMEHAMGTISVGESVTIVIGTFLVLFFAVWFTAHFVAPISFTR